MLGLEPDEDAFEVAEALEGVWLVVGFLVVVLRKAMGERGNRNQVISVGLRKGLGGAGGIDR